MILTPGIEKRNAARRDMYRLRPNVAEFVAKLKKHRPQNTLNSKEFKECCDLATIAELRKNGRTFWSNIYLEMVKKKPAEAGL